MTGDTDELLERNVYLFGQWEPALSHYLRSSLQPGDTFVDVGAHIGYFSLLASKLVGDTGRVLSFEASPSTAADFQHHVDLNRCTNVTLSNIAVSDQDETVNVFEQRRGNRGMNAIWSDGTGTIEAEVEAKPLASLIDSQTAPGVRVVKIDVEGVEYRVLRGLIPLLPEIPRVEIAVEISPGRIAQTGSTVEALLGEMREFGFHAYELENSYDPASYLHFEPPAELPRIVRSVEKQTDIILSRVDADALSLGFGRQHA